MMELLKKTEFSEDANFFDSVKTLIRLYGYEITAEDNDLFYIIVSREIERLNNDCNTELVPEGLKEFLKERIVGAFYGFKISVNGLGDGGGEYKNFGRMLDIIIPIKITYTVPGLQYYPDLNIA